MPPTKQTKDTIVIKVFDKVSKQLLGVWVNGKVTSIKHSKVGRRTSKMVPRYVLEFEDKEGTQYECGYDEVVDYITAYQTIKGTAASTEIRSADAQALIGLAIYTMWTLNLNHLAGGGEPPEWFKTAKMQDCIWLRKCKIAKYHNTLKQFELHYTCGYIRFVTNDAMQEFLRLNEGYKQRMKHPKIQELLGYAQMEWDASKFVEEPIAMGDMELKAAEAESKTAPVAGDAGSKEVVDSDAGSKEGAEGDAGSLGSQAESKTADAESKDAQDEVKATPEEGDAGSKERAEEDAKDDVKAALEEDDAVDQQGKEPYAQIAKVQTI